MTNIIIIGIGMLIGLAIGFVTLPYRFRYADDLRMSEAKYLLSWAVMWPYIIIWGLSKLIFSSFIDYLNAWDRYRCVMKDIKAKNKTK